MNMSSHIRVFQNTTGFGACRARGDYPDAALPVALVRHVAAKVWHVLPHKYRVRVWDWQAKRKFSREARAVLKFNADVDRRHARGDFL